MRRWATSMNASRRTTWTAAFAVRAIPNQYNRPTVGRFLISGSPLDCDRPAPYVEGLNETDTSRRLGGKAARQRRGGRRQGRRERVDRVSGAPGQRPGT